MIQYGRVWYGEPNIVCMAWHEIIIIVVVNYFCKILCQLSIWYSYILYHLLSYRRGGLKVFRLTCLHEIKARPRSGQT